MNLKTTLKLEELTGFILALFFYSHLPYSWGLFALLFFLPDLGMLGYLSGPRPGAFTYNLFHHKGIAILLVLGGWLSGVVWLQLAGTVLFAHSCFDRTLGYGLKTERGFHFTHLGQIGKENTSVKQ